MRATSPVVQQHSCSLHIGNAVPDGRGLNPAGSEREHAHSRVQTQLCLFQPSHIQIPLDVLLCACESCQIDALIGLCFVISCVWEAYSDRPLFCKHLHTWVISLMWIGLLGRKALEAFHFFELGGVLVWKTDWEDSLLCLGHSLNRILFLFNIIPAGAKWKKRT